MAEQGSQRMLALKMLASALALLALLLIGATGLLSAYPAQEKSPPIKGPIPQALPARVHQFGDRLPERALLRIGTTRLQHATPIQTLAVSNDGRLLASCGYDKILQVWDARDGKPLWRFELPDVGSWALAFSQDGTELAATSQLLSGQKRMCSFLRWDLETGKATGEASGALVPFDSTVLSVAQVSLRDGGYLMAETTGPDIAVHAPGAGKASKVLRGDGCWFRSVCFSPDGKTLVSLCEDGSIRLWNVADGKAMEKVEWPVVGSDRLRGNGAAITIAPDCKTFAVCVPGGLTLIIDATGRVLRRLPWPGARGVQALQFSADGRSLFTGTNMVRCWQAETGKEIALVSDARQPIVHMAVAPDGKTVAWADADDGLRLADVATGKTLFHSKMVCSAGVAFTATGKYLAAGERGDKDRVAGERGGREILLWDVAKLRTWGNTPSGEPAAVIPCKNVVLDFAFSPDGKRLATVERDGPPRSTMSPPSNGS
jgi:WD40 repeat protein